MKPVAVLITCAALAGTAMPAQAQEMPAQVAIRAGLSLCRGVVEGIVAKKVTKPDFAMDAFAAEMTRPVRLVRVAEVPDAMLPPGLKRFMSDYWHLDAGPSGGVFVAASRFVPRCEVVAGGGVDLQPTVLAELATPAFSGAWTRVEHQEEGAADMASDHFKLASNKREELLVSYAIAPGGRTDRPQFLGTLMYQIRR